MDERMKISLFNHSFPLRHLYGPAISSKRERLPPLVMVKRRPSSDSLDSQRRRLDRCWSAECDIDPLILRRRLLYRQGHWLQARGIEQEVHPIIWH